MPDADPEVYMPRVTFNASPTLWKFLNDDSFFTGVRGPLGSGKSIACAAKVMKKACEQRHNEHGWRRSRWAITRNCYDDQTEILTEQRGWQFFRDLVPDDRVATLQDERVVYVRPDGVSVSDHDGEMIGFEGESVDFLVTPDHQMWVSKCRTREKVQGPFEMKLAEEIYGRWGYRVRKDAIWDGHTDLTADECELIGYWYAEGSRGRYGGQDTIVVTSVTGIEYTRDVLTRAGVKWTEWQRKPGINFILSCRPEIVTLLNGQSSTKRVPGAIKDAPADHIAAFIEGYFRGDGHQRKDAVTRTIYTSSSGMADDLQELAMKAGGAANISMRDRRGSAVVVGDAVGVVNHREYTVTLLSQRKMRPMLWKQKGRYRGWYKQPYRGKVYCAEMKEPVVFVRRNGKAFWCRRTYPELISTTIKTWMEIFTEASCGPIRYSHPITHHIKIAPTNKAPGLDCEVMFMALDKPDDVRHLKSLDITGAFMNEACEQPEGMIDMLTGRVGRFPPVADGGPTWRGIIADTNATDDQNWWYRYAEQGATPLERIKLHDGSWLDISWHFYTQPPALLECEEVEGGYVVTEPGFDVDEVDPDMVLGAAGRTWYVNPKSENLEHLVAGYYHQQVQNKRFEWIQRFLQAKTVYFIDGKAWVPEYSDAVMSMAVPWDKDIPLIGGIDAGGGTLNPAAVVGQRGKFGDWRILWELSLFDIGLDRFSDLLAQGLGERFPGAERPKFYIDPAGKGRDELFETSVEEHLRHKGFDVELAPTNDPDSRRNALALPMTRMFPVGGRPRPGFIVHTDCHMLRAGLAGKWYLKRVQGRDDRYLERPHKNEWSHVCDAASYMLSGGGELRTLRRDPRLQSNAWDQQGTVTVKTTDDFTGYE